MTTVKLKAFTDLAGCRVELCGPGWGGRYGFTTADAPNSMTCGYKTKTEARRAFIAETFGEVAGRAVLQLLEP